MKKKLAKGYCQNCGKESYCRNCGEFELVYKKKFELSLYILIIYTAYIVLFAISNIDQRKFLVRLFFIGIVIGFGYKIYFFNKEKKRCFRCSIDLIN